jgi:hypothetical protein
VGRKIKGRTRSLERLARLKTALQYNINAPSVSVRGRGVQSRMDWRASCQSDQAAVVGDDGVLFVTGESCGNDLEQAIGGGFKAHEGGLALECLSGALVG